MRILDLFCGAGGAAMGYHQAGFDGVVGIDVRPQPHYPFEFHCADALTFPLDGFDLIHASPPCQRFSRLTPRRLRTAHPDLIGPIRDRLVLSGIPYVIENVPLSPIRPDVVLCGSTFGDLTLRRHRHFEIGNIREHLFLVPPCQHHRPFIGVYGHAGGYERRRSSPRSRTAARADAMGIDWMTGAELSEALPPAYTRIIGEWLIPVIMASHP